MLRAYKYRLYPTKAQAVLINKNIGACRFVYNLALETKNYAYTSHRINISHFDLMRQVTELKKDCQWLKEVDSQALQQPIHNLGKAFLSFFKGAGKYPNFKKNKGTQSFRNPHGKLVNVKGNKIMFPKFTEGVRFVQDRAVCGKIISSTVSKTATGKYYISVLVDTGISAPKPEAVKDKTTIGIDLGLKNFLITSEGIKVEHPKHLQKSILHLKYLQRQASKKKKGSNNKKKAWLKVALQHEKIVNQRKDFLHKLSTRLINSHDTLCLEDLNIKGMVKNHNLAQSISGSGWGMFVEMCKYKAKWYGKNILQIPTFEPSTKICSNCGATNNALTLADREWLCICGTLHDRDINAAKNIKNYSLKNCVGVQRKKHGKLPVLKGALNHEVIS